MLVSSSTVAVNISRFTAVHDARNGELNNLESSNVAHQLLPGEGEWKGLRLVHERQIVGDRNAGQMSRISYEEQDKLVISPTPCSRFPHLS